VTTHYPSITIHSQFENFDMNFYGVTEYRINASRQISTGLIEAVTHLNTCATKIEIILTAPKNNMTHLACSINALQKNF
jgi:hypothetical protein